jgi:hypothetical protein
MKFLLLLACTIFASTDVVRRLAEIDELIKINEAKLEAVRLLKNF